jgi:hypothetical protein
MTSIIRVKNLAQTLRTRRDIWEDKSRSVSRRCAFTNHESRIPGRIEEGVFKALNEGSRGSLPRQTKQKFIKQPTLSFGVDEYTLW